MKKKLLVDSIQTRANYHLTRTNHVIKVATMAWNSQRVITNMMLLVSLVKI